MKYVYTTEVIEFLFLFRISCTLSRLLGQPESGLPFPTSGTETLIRIVIGCVVIILPRRSAR